MALLADLQQWPAAVVALPAEIDMANAGRVGQQLGSALAAGVKTCHSRHDGHQILSLMHGGEDSGLDR
jgi:hypothetical protein